jgi:serpin B
MNIFLAPVVMISLLLGGCSKAPWKSHAQVTPSPSVDVLKGSETETKPLNPAGSVFEMFRMLGQDPKNVVLSPLSLKLAFGILYPGASSGTRSALESLFGFSKSRPSITPDEFALADESAQQKKSLQLVLANSIWLKEPKQILPEYRAALDPLRAEAQRLQLKELNAWVGDKTRNRIPRMFESLRPGLTAVALNTLYLKASWSRPFPVSATAPGRFQSSPHGMAVTPLMHLKAGFRYLEAGAGRWIELPYQDGPLVMLVGIPKKRFDLASVTEKLNTEHVKEILSKMKQQTMDLVLPKFSVTLKESLEPLMRRSGFTALFGKGAFPKILRSGDWSATDVIQAVSLDVDENGTEAAAATAVTLERGMPGLSSAEPFFVDQPFVFLVVNSKSGEVYFLGRILSPSP